MGVTLDQYTDSFIDLWGQFRTEAAPDPVSDPFSIDEKWQLQGPTETLDKLWAAVDGTKDRGGRAKEILARVRAWLQGAEQSAVKDRIAVEGLFERCQLRTELHRWKKLSASARGQVVDQLLRTLASLSAVIRQEGPKENDKIQFRIDWQHDGDGLGCWTGPSPTEPYSLFTATKDLASFHGGFPDEAGTAVASQILADIRHGDLNLPLLARGKQSTEGTTWLRRLAPGGTREKGLLLPERRPAVEDEIALWQHAPRVARVFEEALFVAAKVNVDPVIQDWNEIPDSRSG